MRVTKRMTAREGGRLALAAFQLIPPLGSSIVVEYEKIRSLGEARIVSFRGMPWDVVRPEVLLLCGSGATVSRVGSGGRGNVVIEDVGSRWPIYAQNFRVSPKTPINPKKTALKSKKKDGQSPSQNGAGQRKRATVCVRGRCRISDVKLVV